MNRINVIIIALLFLFIYGCAGEPGEDNSEGSLTLQFLIQGSGSRFSTISPNLNIEDYIIDFISYNGISSEKSDVYLTEESATINLAVGTWEIKISAEDSAGNILAESLPLNIGIEKNSDNNVIAVLIPLSGDGTLDIELDLSAKPVYPTVNTVSYTIDKGVSTSIQIETGELSEPYRLTRLLETGTDYRLKFEITTNTDTIMYEGAFHIFKDTTTSDLISIPSADFARGYIIIADHSAVYNFDNIPAFWREEVKKMLLLIGGESHGRAYNYGLDLVEIDNPDFEVLIQFSGIPESYTDQHLRSSRSYRFGELWSSSMGEEDCYTNIAAIDKMKTGLTYTAENYTGKIIQGFGWCWDMTWGNGLTDEKDPVYGCGWAGSSRGTPEDPDSTYGLPWGLDEADNSITGNSVNMLTYLNAITDYNAHEPNVLFIYTTGPVDGYTGESNYQRYLKHEYIRDWVYSKGGVLFDYADILSWDYTLNQATTATWDSNTFPTGNVILATGGDGFDAGEGGCHISEEGCRLLGKAVWWMLARIAGWDGS